MANKNRDAGLRAERTFAIALQKAAGRVVDPVLEKLITTTGRVGQITDLGFDILIGNPEDGTDLVGEAKRRKSFFTAPAMKALAQIFRISVEWNRQPFMGIALASDAEMWVETTRGKKLLPRQWVLFTREYAEELLRTRRLVAEMRRADPAFDRAWQAAHLEDAVNGFEMVAVSPEGTSGE